MNESKALWYNVKCQSTLDSDCGIQQLLSESLCRNLKPARAFSVIVKSCVIVSQHHPEIRIVVYHVRECDTIQILIQSKYDDVRYGHIIFYFTNEEGYPCP